jgi:hypothetical protein
MKEILLVGEEKGANNLNKEVVKSKKGIAATL